MSHTYAERLEDAEFKKISKTPEEGDDCPARCGGTLSFQPAGPCQCSVQRAPCSNCTESLLICDNCGEAPEERE